MEESNCHVLVLVLSSGNCQSLNCLTLITTSTFATSATLRPQSGRRACPVGRPIAADRVHASRRSHGTAIPIPGEPPHAATWKSRTLTFFQANCPSGSISAGQGRHETAGSVRMQSWHEWGRDGGGAQPCRPRLGRGHGFYRHPIPNRGRGAVYYGMGTNEIASRPGQDPDRDPDEGAGAGRDRVDWGGLLETYRDRLRRMVALRLDDRLRGRVDPSDVIQETFLEALRRQAEYARDPEPMPPFLWLRFLTLQQLQLVHRRNLKTAARDPREVSLHAGAFPAASSAALAAQLLGHDTRASEAALRAEQELRLLAALETMDAVDREVLVLRHLEQLTNGECARVLGLQESAATKRYIRALKRLKEILSALPGGASGIRP